MTQQQQQITINEKLDALNTFGINLDKAVIFVSGQVDENLCIVLRIKYHMLREYWSQHLKEDLKTISLVMNSTGGDASTIMSILDFYDELKKDGVTVNAHVEGNCMSAATFIIAGASGKRTATKRCRFMVHEIQLSNIEGTRTQVKSFQDEVEYLQQQCYELYAILTAPRKKKMTKDQLAKSTKDWEKLCEKETYFGSDDALKYGMIDAIV